MTDVLAELRERAEAATPGPWEHNDIDMFDEFPSEIDAVIDGPDGGLLVQVPTGVWQERDDSERQGTKARRSQAYRDAAYIAAANPKAILELLALLDEERARGAELRGALTTMTPDSPDWDEGLGECRYCLSFLNSGDGHNDDCPWVAARALLERTEAS